MIDYHNWLDRWDAQQTYHLPAREERFQFILDVIEVHFDRDLTVVDLASGPGSLSQRIVQRFPSAEVYAVDIDPILLQIAEETITAQYDQIHMVEADLRESTWFDAIDREEVDVVVSTTALHWLPPADLLRLYKQLPDILSDTGIFLNGDHIRYAPSQPRLQEISDRIKNLWEERGDRMVEGEHWDVWWESIISEFKQHGLEDIVKERERRFHWKDHTEERSPSFPLQNSALLDAGFSEVDTIWQHLHNRILLAIL